MPYPFSNAVPNSTGGFDYPASNVCIYCEEKTGLSLEHIVPKGLSGDLTLPRSSCENCRAITSKLETFVLRRMLGNHRRRFGYKSQTKERKRKVLRGSLVRHEEDGNETVIELGGDDLPLWSFALPVYGTPMILALGSEKDQCSNDRIHVSVSRLDAEMALAVSGGERPVSMPPMPYDAGIFMRFIAKVAHSYATATLGRDAFRPILTNFIRYGHQTPRTVIGGELEIETPEAYAYTIRLGLLDRYDGERFLAAKIRLLPYMGTPSYIAVVGDEFHDDLSAIEHCSYAKPARFKILGADGEPTHSFGF